MVALIVITSVLLGAPKWLIDKLRKRTLSDKLGHIEKNSHELADKVENGAGAIQSSRAIAEALLKQSRNAAHAQDKTSALEEDDRARQQEIEALTRTIEELKAGARANRPGMEDALAALQRGETDKAEALFDKIAEARIAEGAAANSQTAQTLRNKGNLLSLHDMQGAIRAYAKATVLAPDDLEGWTRLGLLQKRSGALDAARQSYEHVLALSSHLTDRAWEAAAAGNLGLIYGAQGDLPRAETMFKRDLELSKKLGSKESSASAFASLGLIEQVRGNLKKAEKWHQKSLEMEKKLGRKEGIARKTGNLALIYRRQGNLSRAEEMYLRSLEIEQELGRKEDMAASYGNLGLIYQMQGDFSLAEAMFKRDLELSEELGRKEGRAIATANLGSIYEKQGDMTRACTHWVKALSLYREIGMQHMIEQVEGWIREAGCADV